MSWLRERPPKVDDQGNRRNIHAKEWIAGYGDKRIIRSSTETEMHQCRQLCGRRGGEDEGMRDRAD